MSLPTHLTTSFGSTTSLPGDGCANNTTTCNDTKLSSADWLKQIDFNKERLDANLKDNQPLCSSNINHTHADSCNVANYVKNPSPTPLAMKSTLENIESLIDNVISLSADLPAEKLTTDQASSLDIPMVNEITFQDADLCVSKLQQLSPAFAHRTKQYKQNTREMKMRDSGRREHWCQKQEHNYSLAYKFLGLDPILTDDQVTTTDRISVIPNISVETSVLGHCPRENHVFLLDEISTDSHGTIIESVSKFNNHACVIDSKFAHSEVAFLDLQDVALSVDVYTNECLTEAASD